MRIGIVCEIQEQPPEHAGRAADVDAIAEFATATEVEHLASAITALGHEVITIGDFIALVRYFGRGETVDLVFNYAAGVCGSAREAQAPALLEALRLPYTGADAFTLTLCIDKAIIKRLWRAAGLPTPDFGLVSTLADVPGVASELAGFPLFVKPVREGSSKGISSRSVVHSETALQQQAAYLLKEYRQPVLVEPYLPGREFSVGVLGSGTDARVLGVVEISPGAMQFVDLLGKKAWNPRTFLPVVDVALHDDLCRLGLLAYRSVDCRSIGRVDIRLDRNGRPQLLEINPNPGLHPTRSALPAMAQFAGYTYADLIGCIIGQAAPNLAHAAWFWDNRAAFGGFESLQMNELTL